MPQLDRTDRTILQALRNNARMSNKDLARRAGVAQSTCLERVRRLQRLGVIRGFHAQVDGAALGVPLQAMISVRLHRHQREGVEAFQAHLEALDEVMSVYHVAGQDDYLVHVATRDPEHLRELVLSAFTSHPEVQHVQTGLVFESFHSLSIPGSGSGEAAHVE